MTTITYFEGIIAYDSRQTINYQIVSDNCDKMVCLSGVRSFHSGNTGDKAILLRWYLGETEVAISGGCSALIADKHRVYYAGWNKKDGFFLSEVSLDEPFAIGGGQDYALTAMDMGASAKEAVKWAMKRDCGTGGRIRTYKVPLS